MISMYFLTGMSICCNAATDVAMDDRMKFVEPFAIASAINGSDMNQARQAAMKLRNALDEYRVRDKNTDVDYHANRKYFCIRKYQFDVGMLKNVKKLQQSVNGNWVDPLDRARNHDIRKSLLQGDPQYSEEYRLIDNDDMHPRESECPVDSTKLIAKGDVIESESQGWKGGLCQEFRWDEESKSFKGYKVSEDRDANQTFTVVLDLGGTLLDYEFDSRIKNKVKNLYEGKVDYRNKKIKEKIRVQKRPQLVTFLEKLPDDVEIIFYKTRGNYASSVPLIKWIFRQVDGRENMKFRVLLGCHTVSIKTTYGYPGQNVKDLERLCSGNNRNMDSMVIIDDNPFAIHPNSFSNYLPLPSWNVHKGSDMALSYMGYIISHLAKRDTKVREWIKQEFHVPRMAKFDAESETDRTFEPYLHKTLANHGRDFNKLKPEYRRRFKIMGTWFAETGYEKEYVLEIFDTLVNKRDNSGAKTE